MQRGYCPGAAVAAVRRLGKMGGQQRDRRFNSEEYKGARDRDPSRSRLIRLLAEFPQRLVWAVFVLCMGFLSIAILSAVAMVSHTPFVFPLLGRPQFSSSFARCLPVHLLDMRCTAMLLGFCAATDH